MKLEDFQSDAYKQILSEKKWQADGLEASDFPITEGIQIAEVSKKPFHIEEKPYYHLKDEAYLEAAHKDETNYGKLIDNDEYGLGYD